MRIEEAVTKAWASVLTEQILQEVMSGLRQMKFDLMLSGEDSGLKNVWEEICAQVQVEESFFWDAYLETIEQAIGARLDELDRAELLALWSTTDSGWDWIFDHHADKDGDQEAPVDPSEIISELRAQLLAMADEYTNDNISRHKALHYGYDDYEDEEEDDEEDEEDFEEEAEDDYPINDQDQEPRAESTQTVLNDQLNTASPAPAATAEESSAVDARSAEFGKDNKLVTREAAEKAREILRKKLAQLNTGLDPEMLQAGMTLDQARADLAGLEQRLKEDQGPVTDARLEDRVREYRNLVSEMEAKQAESIVNDRLTTEDQAQGGTNAAIPATPSAEEMADLKAQMDQAIAELASILGAQIEPNRGATYQAGSGGAQALNESGDGGNLPG